MDCASYLQHYGWDVVHPDVAGVGLVAIRNRERLFAYCRSGGFPVTDVVLNDIYRCRIMMNWDPVLVIAREPVPDRQREAAQGLGLKLIHYAELRSFAEPAAETIRN